MLRRVLRQRPRPTLPVRSISTGKRVAVPPRRLRVFVPSTPHNAEPHLKPPADVDGGSVGRPEVRRKQHPKPPAGDECNIKAADGVHVRNESGE